METSVDTLVYQLEDDDTNVRWNTLQKLRRIAAVETSHFPVRNTRRFLQCVRRRIVGEEEPNVAIEALRLLSDVMVSLGDNVDQILSSILPHLIPNLPRKRKSQDPDGDSDDEKDILQEEMFQVFRKYTNVTNDLQAVADLLVNIGLGSGHGSVRETSLLVLMRLLDDRFQKRTMARGDSARSAIGRGDKALIVALVQAIIPALEDSNDKVVVAAEEAIAKLQSYWGSRFSSEVMKFLSSEDKRTLNEHHEPIADFFRACSIAPSPPPSPPQSSRPNSAASASSDRRMGSSSSSSPSKVHPLNAPDQLHFGFLKGDILTTLLTNTSNSNADWKKRAAAVEKLYAACKQVDVTTLRGATAEERAERMDELDGLFDILVRLTQDVDVHLVKRALQITQILFRKLSPPRQHANDGNDTEDDTPREIQKDAAFYMTKMLAPMVETSANFAGDDDEMEGFVYALLGQVFESGCVGVSLIEQVLSRTSLRHRRAQVREEALKVWMVLLLIAEREDLLPTKYAPSEDVVQTLGRLLGDTNAHVRDMAFETAAVLTTLCHCNIYALLEAFVDDEYVADRVDWAALRARLRRKHIPELRSNSALRLKSTAAVGSVSSSRMNRLLSSVEQSLDGNRSTTSEEGPTTVDIGDKLSALRKKMDQLRQPRTKRVRRPNSQENMATSAAQHSPQHLQSLQSDARNYEDRPLKSKFIERQKELEAGELSPSQPSPDERPIRPMATSGDPDQIYLNLGDQDAGDIDNNEQEPRYLEPHEITPLINSKQDLSKVLTQLRSEDWEANFDALSTVRRLAMHHASMIDAGKVHAIVVEILKQVPNLRSSVSKNALLALESMCSAFSRTMDSEVENIVPVLLKRCADSNAFVCESAAASLHAVVLKCSTPRVVAALGSHVSSKASPIRREVARGVHALILGLAVSIHASKDLSSILQLVGRCLEDSNNEVRDIAKQSVLYLHYKQRMSGERIKRYLPAAAQTKVDSVLSGKVGYAPPVLPAPSSGLDPASDLPSAPALKKREAPAAPVRAKKTTKPLSSRTSPPTSSNGTRSTVNAEELTRLETKLDSSNWKDRFDALNETTDFICSRASAVVESGQMLNLFDLLIKRLDDGNAKVNVLALECMNRIVPAVGSGMEQVLPNFVPAITKNLANARTSSLAQSVVQQLCAHADNRSLCQQVAIQARNSNSRVVPVLLDTLAQLTAQSVDDKSNYVLTRHVLPLALDLLKEAKSGVKEANSRLLRELRRTLGSAAVSSAASKLSTAQQDKLAAILR
ncbi:hypothetical protein PHYSODRAFT_504746 [Phytophthora sojae]|uniref:TOG domain-containing protein n=1 Tax=Phytophthora sojae (strain P6497) TaxID=1094619 RepID=G4ZMT0_PHYSP|nr:hypothetical protein PHYSODRAFT_504746 [Phytophthora sojae]EGZ16050.1 hypothetical protein PHYSODRAFT_504746 [Phytophthora sojae]|eukprot:XP_009529799.1 hypothetical protein PHYSODRAFT_504746 [Phytophthora sojae]